MKKLLAVGTVLVLLCGNIFADDSEILESIDAAKGFVEAGDYTKALEELNFAVTKINEVKGDKLAVFLPEALEGYTKDEESTKGASGMAAMFGNDTQAAAVTYKKEGAEGEEYSYSTINLSIAVGGMMGKAGAMMMMYGGEPGSKALRIKGYKGTISYDKNNKSGKVVVSVGDKITITAEGSSIENSDILKTLVESIELGQLEKEFK